MLPRLDTQVKRAMELHSEGLILHWRLGDTTKASFWAGLGWLHTEISPRVGDHIWEATNRVDFREFLDWVGTAARLGRQRLYGITASIT